jgi:hypothetical protein
MEREKKLNERLEYNVMVQKAINVEEMKDAAYRKYFNGLSDQIHQRSMVNID